MELSVRTLRKKRKQNKNSVKSTVNADHINNRILLVGLSFSVKTYLILKCFS